MPDRNMAPKGARRVLVMASTFPASPDHKVPAFVRDQVLAMKSIRTGTDFTVLAPHDARMKTKSRTAHPAYDEVRFHYAWPHSLETLTSVGILPALQEKRARWFLVPALFVGECAALIKEIRRQRPDFIYAHWLTPQGVVAWLCSRVTGVPYVITTHAADASVWHKVPVIGPALVRRTVNGAAAVTAVSRRSMSKLRSFFSDSQWATIDGKTAVIPMGVDLDVPHDGRDQRRDSSQVGNQGLELLFLGRLAEKKGLIYLFEALNELKARVPIRLTVAGDGPLLSELQEYVSRHDLKNDVTFLGYVSGASKTRALQAADVVVLPSIVTDGGDAEGLPVVFMEAMAHGKLCIASDVSGADDFVRDGYNGFIVPQQDPAAIAEAVARISRASDAELRDVQQRARETADQFAWGTIASEHLKLFTKHLPDGKYPHE